MRKRVWRIWRRKEQPDDIDHLWQQWKDELAMGDGPIKPVTGPKPNKGFDGDCMRQARYWHGK